LNQRDLPWMESEIQFSDFVQSLRVGLVRVGDRPE